MPHITTEFPICLICKNQPTGYPEHVIPQCIGGRLSADLLCDDCNHGFGTELVSTLCGDPLVQWSILSMRDVIPSIFKKSYKSPTFVGKADDGSTIKAKMAGNRPSIVGGEGANKSRIIDTELVPKVIKKRLIQQGIDPAEAAAQVERFVLLSEGEQFPLPGGHVIKKPLPTLINEAFVLGNTTNIRLIALMALEFLALPMHLGAETLGPTFDHIRTYITTGAPSDHIYIESARGDEENVSPIHIIRILPHDKYVVVEVRIFRWLVYQVHLLDIQYAGPDGLYFEDLQGMNQFAPTLSDFFEDKYYNLSGGY